MKNLSKIVFGAILIVLGVLFLGNNYDWFDLDISFYKIAKWWPLLIILSGIGVFLDSKRSFGNPLSIISLAVAIPFALFSLVNSGREKIEDKIVNKLEDEFFDENLDENNEDFSYQENEVGDRKEQQFSIENEIGLTKAKLDFGGGAAEFKLEPTDDYLFYAKTYLTQGSYKLESDKNATEKEIKFEMMNKNNKNGIHIDSDNNFDNDIYLKLNPKIDWDVDLGIGAGELDFDFSKFKIEKLKIETGVAAVNIKLSDLKEKVQVDLKSGVAKITLHVPKGVGCQIKLDGAMNSKDFDGFEKVKNGVWETSNYDSSTKKIMIDMESGLSSIKVLRY